MTKKLKKSKNNFFLIFNLPKKKCKQPCDYTCWTCSGTANTCLTCNSLSTNRVYDSGAYTCLCEDGFYDGSTGTTYI